MGTAWAINEDGGSPEYAAQQLRRLSAAGLYPGVSDRFGARQGVRPHSDAVLTVSGATWTVHDLTAVVYPGLTSASGPYTVEQSQQSGSLNPADGSNPRIDAIDLQVRDDDEDTSGERDVRIVYVPGAPAGSPSPPAQTPTSLRLGTILVPAGGSPSPTVETLAPYTVSSGGILPVRDSGEMPTAGRYEGMYVDRGDEDELRRWSGSQWEAIASPQTFALATALLGARADFASGGVVHDSDTLTELSGGPEVTVEVPPSGRVLVLWGMRSDIADEVESRLVRADVTMSGANSGSVASSTVCSRRRGVGSGSANYESTHSFHMRDDLEPGSTTFTMRYAISAGEATFDNRILIVLPLGEAA